ncbi:MAG: hypothetical protein V2J55_11670 [Candidatus Competibacteraceae bacterium]|jgi:hypothetical protein|nr:hypothetical protein [Candidatus Competibacteraceae bacterium]
MGNARWNPSDWKNYTRSNTTGRSRAAVFSRSTIREDFDPRRIQVRESRDSGANPASNAVIVAFDETGSMGAIPDAFVREGLGVMVSEILDRKPVTDPHVMIMGFGDAWCDRAPLQATQFEPDIRIAEQLKDIYLEGGGGGNGYESYNLPWYFAAQKTSIDCFEKRGKKGYLFTVGDEPPPPVLLASHVRQVFGDSIERDLDSRDVLAMAERIYEVFHIVIEEGSFYRSRPELVKEQWRELLDERVIFLSDYRRLAETIVSTMEINEGRDSRAVTESWSNDIALVVANAVCGLPRPTDAKSVRF